MRQKSVKEQNNHGKGRQTAASFDGRSYFGHYMATMCNNDVTVTYLLLTFQVFEMDTFYNVCEPLIQ